VRIDVHWDKVDTQPLGEDTFSAHGEVNENHELPKDFFSIREYY
jgi:hypothetical protein